MSDQQIEEVLDDSEEESSASSIELLSKNDPEDLVIAKHFEPLKYGGSSDADVTPNYFHIFLTNAFPASV